MKDFLIMMEDVRDRKRQAQACGEAEMFPDPKSLRKSLKISQSYKFHRGKDRHASQLGAGAQQGTVNCASPFNDSR